MSETHRSEYAVAVGNVGYVYQGFNRRRAAARYAGWVFRSKSVTSGRARGEAVYLFKDGELAREYAGRAENSD